MPTSRENRISVLSRLGSLLRLAKRNPTPSAVHRLRTTIRRVETAVQLESRSNQQTPLKRLERIRKSAGDVRDIDVQIDILESFQLKRNRDAAKVHRTLSSKRERRAKKLLKTIKTEFDGDYSGLKEVATLKSPAQSAVRVDLSEIAAKFLASVNEKELTPGNLHAFRIACKRLRYSAELAPESEIRDQLTSHLKLIQDAIGVWHDHLTLSFSAEKVLGSGMDNSFQRKLKVLTYSKFIESLRTVHEVEAQLASLVPTTAARKPSKPEHLISARAVSAS